MFEKIEIIEKYSCTVILSRDSVSTINMPGYGTNNTSFIGHTLNNRVNLKYNW